MSASLVCSFVEVPWGSECANLTRDVRMGITNHWETFKARTLIHTFISIFYWFSDPNVCCMQRISVALFYKKSDQPQRRWGAHFVWWTLGLEAFFAQYTHTHTWKTAGAESVVRCEREQVVDNGVKARATQANSTDKKRTALVDEICVRFTLLFTGQHLFRSHQTSHRQIHKYNNNCRVILVRAFVRSFRWWLRVYDTFCRCIQTVRRLPHRSDAGCCVAFAVQTWDWLVFVAKRISFWLAFAFSFVGSPTRQLQFTLNYIFFFFSGKRQHTLALIQRIH